jgi:Helix-turn-helix.
MTDNKHNELTLDQLRARRDKQGLSVADMANRLKVSREVINYIEQGEFNRIGSATFIRGHVGNYARELGFDPQTVLDLVPAQHLKPYEPKLTSSKVSNPLSRVKTHSSGFGRYVLGTFLVAALGLSFYFVYDKWDSHETDFARQNAQQNSQLPLTESNEKKKVIYSSLLPQADLADEESNHDEALLPLSDDHEIMTEDFDGHVTDGTPETNNGEPLEDTEAETGQDYQSDAVVESATKETLYTIRFNLSEQAWVSVKTKSGDTVVSDLIGPGERQYNADEPIHFRIGNASQIKLFINDQAVDLTRNTSQNVADFDWPTQEG